jgi:hypothetical protein
VTQSPATTDPIVWGEIEGQTITFPMEVTRFDAATFGYTVPLEAAAALLPGDAFEPLDLGGVAQMVIAACDYHENPWGDYLELNLGFLARPVGAAPEVNGSFVYRMPVDQAFTCKAGNDVMGFPKTVEDLSVTRADGRVTFAWHRDGALVLSLDFPDAPAAGDPVRVETDSYSYLDGKPYATSLGMDLGTGAIDPADVVLELGDDVVADELRALGLPKTPDFGAWGTDLTASFQLGRPV